MSLRFYLLFGATCGVFFLAGRNLPVIEEANGDIALNEKACTVQAPKGFAAYPITRRGELRGCLFVNKDDPDIYKVVRRVQM